MTMSKTAFYVMWTCMVLLGWAGDSSAEETVLPQGDARASIASRHFPDRVHEFVWRNWNAVEPAKLAKILGASVEDVTAMGPGTCPGLGCRGAHTFPSIALTSGGPPKACGRDSRRQFPRVEGCRLGEPGLKAYAINLSAPRLLGLLNDDMALSDWLAPGEQPRGSPRGRFEVRNDFPDRSTSGRGIGDPPPTF